jgi:hypothetical protein
MGGSGESACHSSGCDPQPDQMVWRTLHASPVFVLRSFVTSDIFIASKVPMCHSASLIHAG